jgi:PAS domain S-box-containing protein
MTQIEAATAQSQAVEGLNLGLAALRDLGVDIPMQPTPQEGLRLHEKFIGLVTNESIERLDQLPIMSDESAMAISTLLASVMSTAYIANPPLFPIISYNGAILNFEFGLDVWLPFFVGGIALVNIASITPDTPDGDARHMVQFNRQLITLIQALLDKPITARSRTKGLMMLAFTTPWFETYQDSIMFSRTTYQSGHETGDWLYGSYGAALFAVQSFAAGMNLPEYQRQLSADADSLQKMGQVMTPTILAIHLQAADNFLEPSPEPHSLNGTFFNEDEWLSQAISADDLANRHWLSTDKFILAYHFDRDEVLDDYAAEAEEFLVGGPCHLSVAQFYFYQALARLRQLGDGNATNHPDILNLVEKNLRWMGLWSEATPSTFQHKHDLMVAEKARVTGDLDVTLDHYEKAITGARESGFIHEEALANELYARFWMERGNERFARIFIREAHSLYRKWGAFAKAEHLTKRYPNWLISHSILVDEPRTQIIPDQVLGGLDLVTVLKASQDIAGELTLDGLLAKLTTNVIENSGAQQGYLILEQDGQWIIGAQADADEMEPQVEKSIPIAESDLLSEGIVRYVARTQRTVLLDNASQSGEFIDDPYVRRHQAKSIICVPLINQGKTSAILYLENNLSPGVFTSERVELLQLLSSQMAISIDNARTHDQLEKLLEERSKALISAEAQIRSIFENSPLGIALTSFTGEILTVNQALLAILRISEEDLLRQGVTNFYVDPNDRGTLLAEVHESGSVRDFGMQLVRSDGEYFYASVNMSRLDLEKNEVLLTIIDDVTDEITIEQEFAAIEERERLARELHDSVSQILFTAGMIADATPRLREKDPTRGQENLELLSFLIRGASAEMRSLLLELRPDTLKDQTLGKLLETLVAAARARTRAAVSLKVESDCLLPENVTLTLHRIAQESLNNIAKHAEASEVVIHLNCSPESAKLSIEDNGRGFDPQTIPAGHLGIGIMRERAQKIGATLQINSKPGDGTSVLVTWSGD